MGRGWHMTQDYDMPPLILSTWNMDYNHKLVCHRACYNLLQACYNHKLVCQNYHISKLTLSMHMVFMPSTNVPPMPTY
jgi:hypothetical protein